MKKIFWLCLLLLIPGMLARVSLDGVGIMASDIILPIFAIIWIGKKIIKNQKFPRNKWIIPCFLFLFWALISWLIGAWNLGLSEKIFSISYIIRLSSFFIFGWATMDILRKENNDKNFAGFFMISGIVIFLGFLQFFIVPDIAQYSTEGGWDPHTSRLLGTWLDPNYLAGFLGFLLPISIGKCYQTTKSPYQGTVKISRKFLALLIISALVALFLTFSRSGYLAAGFGLFIFFFFKDWKIILLAIIIATIGIFSNERATKRVDELWGTFTSIIFQDTAEIDPTAKLRIQNWEKSYSLFEKNKIAGIGYNTYRYVAAEEGIVDESYFSAGGADSTHLTVLVTTGIIGVSLYLLFIGNILRLSWQKFRQEKETIYLGFFAGFCSLIVHATFVNSLFFPLIFLPVMTVWGMISRED